MNLVSLRIITGDVARLVAFYERATKVAATWAGEDFAELRTASGTLAIGSTRTVSLFAPGSARPADNRSVILEFLVADVDEVHRDLSGFAAEGAADVVRDCAVDFAVDCAVDFVNEPTTMPWGNRSLLVRDPDGNLVNFFTPVTPAAVEKFAR
ncbi:VOC family protein [Streptomyces sp. NPDC059917]|uniref:VOC family protein n=1 Tax=Streptomyces sp. NPDC059917 TaxID=3347002 RepID=UPI00365A38F1